MRYINRLFTYLLAVDGWAVTFGRARRARAAAPLSALLAVPNVTAHPSTAGQYSSTNFILFDAAP